MPEVFVWDSRMLCSCRSSSESWGQVQAETQTRWCWMCNDRQSVRTKRRLKDLTHEWRSLLTVEENITETPQKVSTLLKKPIKGTLDSHVVGVKELLWHIPVQLLHVKETLQHISWWEESRWKGIPEKMLSRFQLSDGRGLQKASESSILHFTGGFCCCLWFYMLSPLGGVTEPSFSVQIAAVLTDSAEPIKAKSQTLLWLLCCHYCATFSYHHTLVVTYGIITLYFDEWCKVCAPTGSVSYRDGFSAGKKTFLLRM